MKNLLILLLFYTTLGFAQQQPMETLTKRITSFAERDTSCHIYLETNKDTFEAGEDLWFKATLVDSKSLSLFEADQILYLQLASLQKDSVVWQQMYPIKASWVQGQVYLNDTLPEGRYALKAYTAHSLFKAQKTLLDVKQINLVKNFTSLIQKRRTQFKTQEVPPKKDNTIHFQAFAEGGYLVENLPNVIAFQAVDSFGMPIDVKGELLEDEKKLLSFQSSTMGMGKFIFVPQNSKSYRLQLDNHNQNYPLPKRLLQGTILHIDSLDSDFLRVKVLTHQPFSENQKFFIRVQTRGMVSFVTPLLVKDSLALKFPLVEIPQGVAEVTLYDQALHPLAERLVFIHQDRKIHIAYQWNKTSKIYHPKEKVILNIQTTDEQGKPIQSVLSASLTDYFYQELKEKSHIDAFFLLQNSLKGRIYRPDVYFDEKNTHRKEGLDLLLMTQGWRAYTWNEEALQANASHTPLLKNHLEGKLEFGKEWKGKKEIQYNLLAFDGTQEHKQIIIGDSTGSFALYPEALQLAPRIYLKYIGGKQKNYGDFQFKTDSPFLKIPKLHLVTPFESAEVATSDKKSASPDQLDVLGNIRNTTTLQEVTVKGKGIQTFRDKLLGSLDSIAKYDGNDDYVCENYILNCTKHTNSPSNRKPIEGEIIKDNDRGNTLIYHYPRFTEAELLEKFHIGVSEGFYTHKDYYQPDYDTKPTTETDIRNSILWQPIILTDMQGKAQVSFFCSDIKGSFVGFLEATNGNGRFGKQIINLKVE